MKVLFLGAGASRAAEYPLASGLLDEVVADAADSPGVRQNTASKEWIKLVEEAASLGLDGPLLRSPNPEISLSYLDLWEQAAREGPANVMREARRTGTADPALLAQWTGEGATRARQARRAMREMLASYFGYRSFLDRSPENRPKRNYLKRLFSRLRPGDVIVTLNWDTTAERTLAESGRWSPIDGYGFSRRPARVKRRTREGTSSLRYPRESDIKVLKLHGGVGWYRDEFSPDRIYLSHAYLLQYLPVALNGEEWFFDEAGYDQHVRPDGSRPPLETLDVALEIPSYLKQGPKGSDMRHIWSLADRALARADEVEVWGYSLPESDGLIRLLLSGLSRRLHRGRVTATVQVPDAAARRRWRAFLGPRARIGPKKLG